VQPLCAGVNPLSVTGYTRSMPDPRKAKPSVTRSASSITAETRARITRSAAALFNRDGVHAVSTRHVATAAGISPGNLYYHFANKEEIALSLYGEIERELQRILVPPQGATHTFDEILGYLDRIFSHLWAHRWFYRDIVTLLRDVPGLRERYRELAGAMQANARSIFSAMAQAGWLTADAEQVDLLAANAWIVMSQWSTHWQVMSKRRSMQASDIREGIRHLVALFQPLLRPAEQARVRQLLAP